MEFLKHGCVSFLFLMIAVSGYAQSAPVAKGQAAPSEAPPAPRAIRQRHSGPPCWKQAGITADMVNQRWKIEDNQRLEIAAACSEPKTNAQQKHDQIEQIHANTKQEIAQVIPADELAKFDRCEADLAKTRPVSAPKKELGPCGGVIPTPVASQESHGMEHHPDGAPMNQ